MIKIKCSPEKKKKKEDAAKLEIMLELDFGLMDKEFDEMEVFIRAERALEMEVDKADRSGVSNFKLLKNVGLEVFFFFFFSFCFVLMVFQT